MDRLEVRGRTLAERRAAAVRERIAARIDDEVRGVRAHVDGDRIVLSGRRLAARVMREPVLRWIGSLGR